MIYSVQYYQLELMRLGSFNNFNGEQVVDDLLAHQDLWQAAMMVRNDWMITLRDLPTNYNVDTLFIRTDLAHSEELYALAQGWGADEIEFLPAVQWPDHISDQRILRFWWD